MVRHHERFLRKLHPTPHSANSAAHLAVGALLVMTILYATVMV